MMYCERNMANGLIVDCVYKMVYWYSRAFNSILAEVDFEEIQAAACCFPARGRVVLVALARKLRGVGHCASNIGLGTCRLLGDFTTTGEGQVLLSVRHKDA
ncbi:unnamed protein product [Enterobius vermicularis]|uniref:Ribonuclease P n=1 Tax=Enterobius vermicularis TaxID=51028 RepID=A0A0N4VGX7_ENTVE|nr:unnamed protein product [Enterobius vermicularis]